jgi:hypothetical protein
LVIAECDDRTRRRAERRVRDAGFPRLKRLEELLDTDCQRTVFTIRAHNNSLLLAATDTDLDELIGAVAAEANHEPNRQRLDAAFEALNTAALTHGF